MQKQNKGFALILVVGIILIVSVLTAGGVLVYQQNKNAKNANKPIGGDKDEHGCLIVAGYFWCEVKNKCLRTWEEKCEKEIVVKDETAGWKTYANSEYGFEFKYPDNLVLGKESGKIILEHKVLFEHSNLCDWKEGALISSLLDFKLIIDLVDKNIESALSSGEGIEGANVQKISIGGLNGYKYTWGVEYCGNNYFYLSVAPQKTLVVKSPIVTELSPITPKEEISRYLKIPGIISNEWAETLFAGILSTFKFTK